MMNEKLEEVTETSREETREPTKAEVIASILDQPDMQFVDWKSLMGEGVVVRLHIRRVRFRKRLTFDDLGIHFGSSDTEKKMHEIFRLGMKNLLTKEYLDRIEQTEYRARKILVQFSFETVWGPFVPVTAYGRLREAMDALSSQYYQVCEDILTNYPTIRKQVLANYVEAARQAYRILNKVNPNALTVREQAQEIFYLASIRHKMRKMLPTLEEIKASFSFEISPTYIDLPLLAGADEELQNTAIEKRTISDVTEEEQRELRWRQQGTQERQRMMQAMNEDVVRKAREQKEQRIDQFFTTVVTQLRGLLYDATTNVLASLKDRQRLQPRSVVQLKNLVETLEQLNFYGDKDVERAMNLIHSLVDQPHENRDLSLIEQRLREIAVVMRSTLLQLEYDFREDRLDEGGARDNEDQLKREVAGVPRKPSRDEVREARLSLGFTIPPWEEEREERMEDVFSGILVAEEREERSWS